MTSRQNDRWGAMVTASAGPVLYALKVRARWAWLRFAAKLGKRPRKIIRLSTIGFARWSMVYRVPSGVGRRRSNSLGRPFLLFETNFNGDAEQYLESFSLIVPRAMNEVWNEAYGVPDVRRTSEWEAYVNDKKLPIALYYSAYPGATVRTIRSSLALGDMLQGFRARVKSMREDQFEAEFRTLLSRVQRIRNPRAKRKRVKTGCLTTFIPVIPDHKSRLAADLRVLVNQPANMPHGTHFARWCIIDRLEAPSEYEISKAPFLVFSAWFDGEPRQYLQALYAGLTEQVMQIWRNCGFDGADAGSFGDWMLRYRVKPGAAFAAYDGVTVDEVLNALRVSERFHRFALDAQSTSNKAASLRQAWMSDPLLGG